jgi:hypothetical protein
VQERRDQHQHYAGGVKQTLRRPRHKGRGPGSSPGRRLHEADVLRLGPGGWIAALDPQTPNEARAPTLLIQELCQ